MKKFPFLIGSVILLSSLLLGCQQPASERTVPHGVAVRVDVYCQMPGRTVSRHYADPDKVEAVLTYLRLLQPIGPIPLTAEAKQSEAYEIVVHLDNGSQRIHRQRADSFAAKDRSFWGVIDSELGQQLPLLMTRLPSDNPGTF